MRTLPTCLDQYGGVRVDTDSCQCRLETTRSLRGATEATVTRLARPRVGNRAYIPFFLCSHLPRSYRVFLSFQQSRTLFYFLFYYLLFFTQAVGVTILSSSALHSSFLPHFPASLPYRFLTSSRHGKPHLARVLPSRRYHRECL